MTPVIHGWPGPSQPWLSADGLPAVPAETVPSPLADRLDLHYAVGVLVRQAA